MPLATELFEQESDGGAAGKRERFFQLERCLMRFSDGGMNAPGCLVVPVEGLLDGPAVLIEVGGGIHQWYFTRLVGARLEKQDLKLAQMQIAVVLPARAVLRQ